MKKMIKEYSEKIDGKEIIIKRFESKKSSKKTIIPRGSKTMHQKGSFGWKEPTGREGVSSIYHSNHFRDGAQKKDAMSNGPINIQTRNW